MSHIGHGEPVSVTLGWIRTDGKHLYRYEHAAAHEGAGSGREFTEVLNNALCGAKNVVGALRWLGAGDHYDATSDANTHQLIYLMEGDGTITLNGKAHAVGKGAGIYLGPAELRVSTSRAACR